jgi:hypothetical protein
MWLLLWKKRGEEATGRGEWESIRRLLAVPVIPVA